MSADPLAAVEELNAILESADEKGWLEALREYSARLREYEGVLSPEALEAAREAEYALAYNAIVEGARPDEVKGLVSPGTWGRIVSDGVLVDAARYYVVHYASQGDLERAREYLEAYREYLPEDVARELELVVSGELQQLLSAVAEGDLEALSRAIEELEEKGLLPDAERVLAAAGLDLGEVKRRVYEWRLYERLAEASGPEEALRVLREAAGEAGLEGYGDLEAALEASVRALEAARAGDLEAFLAQLEGVGVDWLYRYTVLRGLAILQEEHPEALASASKEDLERLGAALAKAGVAGGESLHSLSVLGEAAKVIVELNRLASQDPEKALEYWRSLTAPLREAAALLAGLKPEDVERALLTSAEVKRLAGEAAELAGLLREGRYREAYEAWTGLKPEEREVVAALLGVDLDGLDRAIRVAAALQEAASLQNPTIVDVKLVLEKYLGPEEAERVARALLELAPLARVRELAEEGRYGEALEVILSEVPGEERRLAAQYLLAVIAEREGPEALARFIAENEARLKGLVPGELMVAAEMVVGAADAARVIAGALERAAIEVVSEKLKNIVSQVKAAIEARDWRRAERILAENASLLREARLEDGTPLYLLLSETLSLARAGEALDKWAGELERLAPRATAEAQAVAARAENIAGRAEAYMRQIEQLKTIDESVKNQYAEAFKRLAAYAYAVAAQAHLAAGNPEAARRAAEKAASLDRSLEELRKTVTIIAEAASNPEAVKRNVYCILERVIGIRPTGTPRVIAKRYQYA